MGEVLIVVLGIGAALVVTAIWAACIAASIADEINDSDEES